MTRVFISYSRKDKLFAETLNKALKEIGLNSWIDWIDIPPTSDWREQIRKGIESADGFVFLLSPDSIVSQICKEEIDHAVRNGKRLIPVVVRDVRSQDVPEPVNKLNWIFFRETDDFNASLKKLESGIKTDLNWLELHSRLQVRAVEWEKRKDRSLLLRGKDLRGAEEQLANAGMKDPQPTDLQRQYVLESRRRESQTRNTLLSVGGVVLVMLAFLSVFALNQRDLANDNALTAVANQNMAIANEQEAIRQSNISLARQLAAQAQFIFAADPSAQEVAVLLATRSMQLFPTGDAVEVLQNTTLTPSVERIKQNEPITYVAFSPDGKYVLSDSQDGSAYLLERATGKQVGILSQEVGADSPSFSPDGKYVISGSTNGTIQVWEVSTGQQIAQMNHDDSVTWLDFRRDSQYIVSGSRDGTARVWETASGKEVAKMIHDGIVTSVTFSPDETHVLSGSEDKTARFWDATTGIEIARMNHDQPVLAVAFSSEAGLAASGDASLGIRVWETATGNEVSRMDPGGSAESLEFSPNMDYVLSMDATSASVWEINTGNQVAYADFGDYSVEYSALSPDSRYIISRGSDGSARIWEAGTGEAILYMGVDGHVNSIVFSASGKYVAVGKCAEIRDFTCPRGEVVVFETATGKEAARMPHSSRVQSVAFSPDENYVVSGSEDGSVHIWKASSSKEIANISGASYPSFVAFSADSHYVISDGTEDIVNVWEIATGNQVSVIPTDFVSVSDLSIQGKYKHLGFAHDGDDILSVWDPTTGVELSSMKHDSNVSDAAFSADGKYVVSASQDKTIHLWDAASGNELAQIRQDSDIWAVSLSPTAKYVVSADADGAARVWDVSTEKEIARMIHGGRMHSVAFSPDERFVVSASCDRLDAQELIFCQSSTVLVWDVSTQVVIARMTYESEIWDLEFSPDGKHVAAGGGPSDNLIGEPGALLIWEASTGIETLRVRHDSRVSAVAFSPDGRYVASVSGGGMIRVWGWQPNDLIQDACSRVTRNLSPVEWAQYIHNQPFPARQEDAICPNWPIEADTTSTPTVTP